MAKAKLFFFALSRFRAHLVSTKVSTTGGGGSGDGTSKQLNQGTKHRLYHSG